MLQKSVLLSVIFSMLMISGCTTETSTSSSVLINNYPAYNGVPIPITIDRVDNVSNPARNLFSDGTDRLGDQAKTILVSELQRTNYFRVLEKDKASEVNSEQSHSKTYLRNSGAAKYIVVGKITEFTRTEASHYEFFGILGRIKKQIAHAKVTLDITDTSTLQVVCNAEGSAEYTRMDKEVLGFGRVMSYDLSLNGKALELSINNALGQLVTDAQQQKCHLTP